MERIVADRYELEELLGAGKTSEVWCAMDRKLGRRVALKVLAPQADSVRFEREAHAVASLAHEDIMRLYDYGCDGARLYMALEFLSGGTLQDRLADKQPRGDAETWSLARELAAGLAYAHARGVAHGDLKPANVLFDDEGRAKLADFSIARFADGPVTEARTLTGTRAYMSPEHAAGEAATAAGDVYSFGAIVYQMLTGRLPFEADDPRAPADVHRSVRPPLSQHRPDAPPELAATTMAALAENPADRPADGTALLAALGAPEAVALPPATTGLPATAASPSATLADTTPVLPPARTRPRRRTLLSGVVALLALALAGVLLALLVSQAGDGSPGELKPPDANAKAKPPRHRTSTPTTGATAPAEQTSTRQTSARAPTTRAPTATKTTRRRPDTTTPNATTTHQPTTASSGTTPTVTATATVAATTTTATTAPGTTTAPATTTETSPSGTTTTTTPTTTG